MKWLIVPVFSFLLLIVGAGAQAIAINEERAVLLNLPKPKEPKVEIVVTTHNVCSICSLEEEVGKYNEEELDLLARVVYAEARGEPLAGQVAVANVILNRVADERFPDTIRGVIYAPGQFCTVEDGQINLKPNETARMAVLEAIKTDITEGAVYFWNPKVTGENYGKTLTKTLEIGNHRFAK